MNSKISEQYFREGYRKERRVIKKQSKKMQLNALSKKDNRDGCFCGKRKDNRIMEDKNTVYM